MLYTDASSSEVACLARSGKSSIWGEADGKFSVVNNVGLRLMSLRQAEGKRLSQLVDCMSVILGNFFV